MFASGRRCIQKRVPTGRPALSAAKHKHKQRGIPMGLSSRNAQGAEVCECSFKMQSFQIATPKDTFTTEATLF